MPIRLTIEVTSPLNPEDRELLSGVAVMTLAVANHEMARERFPETFGEQAEQPAQPTPCAFIDPKDATRVCIGEVGHRGRHRFRRIPVDAAGLRN